MKNSDNEKLLPTLDIINFEKYSDRELLEHLYAQELQTQVLIQRSRDEIERLTKKVDGLAKAVGRSQFIESPWISFRYVSRQKKIVYSNNFEISFKDSQMTDLLEFMFVKKTGRPRKKKWHISEEARRLSPLNSDLNSNEKVYKAVKRLESKLQKETGFSFLFVDNKTFFWKYTF